MKLDGDRSLIFRLRNYQEDVLRSFREKLSQGHRRLHVVAPPGSGKTVMGIALLLESRCKGVVFSPNAAIQAQWVDRFTAATAPLRLGALDRLYFATSPDGKAPYLSLTYQSITTKGKGTDELHPNARALIDRLVAEDYRCFVLDECHHLTGFWGDVLSGLLEKVEDPVIIGLTATPPIEAKGAGLRSYLDLVGPIDLQVPLPAIVKEGNLAPYQDLVYFTLPEEDEVALLLEGQERYRHLLDRLESLEAPLVPLSFWVQRVLETCRLGKTLLPFDEWLRDAPDQAIAFVRYLQFRGRVLPDTILWVDEMEGACELEDLVLVLADYLRLHLREHEEGRALADEVETTLGELGYRLVGKSFQAVNVGTAQKLTLSRNKLGAMRRILECEMERQLDGLRVLVLTDYEFGRADSDGLDAVEVMDALSSHDPVDELDPIMVTGRSVLVDDDLTPLFLERAAAFAERCGLAFELTAHGEAGYMRIEGTGRDWNTRSYVRLVTELLEEGTTRCLVGTRALLGEGWDSVKLNTLVDLTVVASYVSVNQIRGRSIRKDEDDPFKCANNWDVVTIYPGVEYGLYDFHRLERKHGKFYGVSDDGVIEKGLGHVHPLLSRANVSLLSGRLEEVNADMLRRAALRDGARERWAIGEAYGNADRMCVELRRPEALTRIPRPRQATERIEWMRLELLRQRRERDGALAYWWLGFPLLLGLWRHLRGSWQRRTMQQTPLLEESIARSLKEHGATVLEAMNECKLIDPPIPEEALDVREREGGCYRIVLQGASPETAKIFSEAVWELFGPVQSHKYVIERREIDLPLDGLTEAQILGEEPTPSHRVACHPVPSVLGRRREFAEAFRRAWNRHVSAGEIFYTRKGEGRELVKTWFRKRAYELRRERKEIWQ